MKEKDGSTEDEPKAEPISVTKDIARSGASKNAVGGADPTQSSINSAAIDSCKPTDYSAAAPLPPVQSLVRAPKQKVVSELAPSQLATLSQMNRFHPEPREAKPPEPSTKSTGFSQARPDQWPCCCCCRTDATVNTPTPAATLSVASSVATPSSELWATDPAGPSTSNSSTNANRQPAAPQTKPAAAPALRRWLERNAWR